MRILHFAVFVGIVALVGGIGYLGYATEATWRPWLKAASSSADPPDKGGDADQIELSPQAQKNLKLHVDRVKPSAFQRTLRIPGVVQERPGGCGFVVTAPMAGIVKKISVQRGELVKPGTSLFTLHILSEPLMTAQTGLYKAQRDLQITTEEKKRLSDVQGAISPAKLIEVENQLRRISATIDGFTQELTIRGLTKEEVLAAGMGKFLTEATIRAPLHVHAEPLPGHAVSLKPVGGEHRHIDAFEIEELKVLTGEHVKAGQALGHLADHLVLAIEGKLFVGDVPLVRKAAAEGLPVQVEFPVDDKHQWEAKPQTLQIHYFANKVDTDSQTLGFYLPLVNQSQDFDRDGKSYRVWRFRPGQRVSVRFPVEDFKDVLVLPARAVVREGGDAFVFTENGKFFKRVAVHVLYEDTEVAILPSDGTFAPNERLAHNAAAALNRALKTKAEAGGGGGHSHDH